jgi:rhodanese-related sulfurtransferase
MNKLNFRINGISALVTLAVIFAFGCNRNSDCVKVGVLGKEDFKYKANGRHKGGDITPEMAYTMIKKDPKHVFLVDVRTRVEYQDIGHPLEAYNIPWLFNTAKIGKKGYEKSLNKNFCGDLLARFNPKTDILLMLCRSAKRTIQSTTAAVDCGFDAGKVFNIMGGFEGDKDADKKRTKNGWRLEGLPWAYSMKHKLMYKRDLENNEISL